MADVATLTFAEARRCVLATVAVRMAVEEVPLPEAAGRVLAEEIRADRDLPPVARSVRDGYAVRAADVPGTVDVIGEARAGAGFTGEVGARQAVEIMTGAPMPAGADAVVMVEYVEREGARVRIQRAAKPGDFVNPRAAEARRGDIVVCPGTRLGFAQIAAAASTGRSILHVYTRPRVAILPTGDEVVPIAATPSEAQVRNSNACSLAVQAARAGGIPEILPVARDNHDDTRRLIERGLAADLLLLSGGVSAGKYDLVERVLADLGAEFFFDRVLIQPGQPLVFGRARGVFFFGLPGNPASTMVTYEILARAAQELLGGLREPELPVALARLTRDFSHKTGLTRFLPARLSNGDVTPVPWKGSGDVPALARANAFLIADAERASWNAGDLIEVLPV
jgi:molybdopterin molybdotransferase